MLSKKERDYISGKLDVSSVYARVIEHRIKKKLERFFRLEMPMIMQNHTVTEFCNKITKNSNLEEVNEKPEGCLIVGAAGFEPATSSARGWQSNHADIRPLQLICIFQ